MIVAPGDLIEAHKTRRLVVSSQRVTGLAGVNAWSVLCLTDHGKLSQLILHDENLGLTWRRV